MTAAIWVARWQGATLALFIPTAICLTALALAVYRARRADARRRADQLAAVATIRAELAQRRATQARFDAEFLAIARNESRRNHPAYREDP